MWDPENDGAQCVRDGNGINDPQCCGGSDRAFVLYNANKKYCCDNGKVVRDVSQC